MTLPTLYYLLLNSPPFSRSLNGHATAETRTRLAAVSRILAAFSSIPRGKLSEPGQEVKGRMATITANKEGTGVSKSWLSNFYYMLINHMLSLRPTEIFELEPELPEASVPFLTIHGSKGLEFPFVLAIDLHTRRRPGVDASLRLDEQFRRLAPALYPIPAEHTEIRERQDLVRRFYVAFSRARQGLFLVTAKAHLKELHVGYGPTPGWVASNSELLEAVP